MATYCIKVCSRLRLMEAFCKGETFHAYKIGVAGLLEFLKQDESAELDDCGVYLLLRNEDGVPPEVYVGEAESLRKRLSQHHAKLAKGEMFPWEEAVLFVNKSGEWTKAEIKYMEHLLYEKLETASRYLLKNANTPKKSKVTDPDLCNRHVAGIVSLMPLLGHPKLFVPVTANSSIEGKSAANPITNNQTVKADGFVYKIGEVAQACVPEIFARGFVSEKDVAFLLSAEASAAFVCRKIGFIRERVTGAPEETIDGSGKNRYYKGILLSFAGTQYYLTKELQDDGHKFQNLLDWICAHGIGPDEIAALCARKFGPRE